MEDMELRNREYQEQVRRFPAMFVAISTHLRLPFQRAAMDLKTAEIMQTVREADVEVERVRKEKNNLVQEWHKAVINVSRRDEAVATFEKALKAQGSK